MSEQDHKDDEFKKASAAVYRALAKSNISEISFSQSAKTEPADFVEAGKPVLPSPSHKPKKSDIRKIRGAVDSRALQMRYHNNKLHSAHAPQDQDAAILFDTLEQARCEALGMASMRGVAHNLKATLKDKCRRYDFGNIQNREESNIADVLHLLARRSFTGETLPKSTDNLLGLWEGWLKDRIGDEDLQKLGELVNDQDKFAEASKSLIQKLDLAAQDAEDQHNDQPDNDDEDIEEEPPEDDMEDDQDEDGDESEESSSDTSLDHPMPDDPDDRNSEQEMDLKDDDDETSSMPQEEKEQDVSRRNSKDQPLRRYEIYTTRYDEIIPAERLADSLELRRLRAMLDKQLTHLQGMTTRLANRLQRKLMARQRRFWQFDMEEGILDTARLARIVAAPSTPLSFKQEREDDFKDTVVTLLIDNSGSMRGRPITIAAMTTDIIAKTLERAGVKTEILGFTTRAWKGGKSRDLWVQNGRPPNPGRLNDIRHIIYKSADASWKRSRKNLGLMLKEGILKENIDGEALIWAHSRLLARPEQRRILIVISDGAPVDDSTLSVNPSNILEEDLHNVIEWIESRSPVELSAIGIGHDVTRYYNRAITIADADQLGQALTEQLEDLFEEA